MQFRPSLALPSEGPWSCCTIKVQSMDQRNHLGLFLPTLNPPENLFLGGWCGGVQRIAAHFQRETKGISKNCIQEKVLGLMQRATSVYLKLIPTHSNRKHSAKATFPPTIPTKQCPLSVFNRNSKLTKGVGYINQFSFSILLKRKFCWKLLASK